MARKKNKHDKAKTAASQAAAATAAAEKARKEAEEEESKEQQQPAPVDVQQPIQLSETDDFVSCDDGDGNLINRLSDMQKQKLSMDIAAINSDVVDGPSAPYSTKAASGTFGRQKTVVPKLNLDQNFGASAASHQKVATPPSSRRPDQNFHLQTLHESDYDENNQMDVGQMATTNMSHDSQGQRDAEKEFKNFIEKSSARKTVKTITSDAEDSVSPEKIKKSAWVKQPTQNTSTDEESKVQGLSLDVKQAETATGEAADADEDSKKKG